jgi:hypothetical protein
VLEQDIEDDFMVVAFANFGMESIGQNEVFDLHAFLIARADSVAIFLLVVCIAFDGRAVFCHHAPEAHTVQGFAAVVVHDTVPSGEAVLSMLFQGVAHTYPGLEGIGMGTSDCSQTWPVAPRVSSVWVVEQAGEVRTRRLAVQFLE